METTIVRKSEGGEEVAVLALYPLAFPDEELRPVVRGLFEMGDEVLSLVMARGDAVLGHVMFTICGEAALLAPLGVRPEEQGNGLGGALVREGLKRLAAQGVAQVFVLGDPKYYSRFGFQPDRAVQPPYPMPEEWADAWQSLVLRAPGVQRLVVPQVWMDPALWGE